jgi:peptidoglycan/xylan/chitin deacetylase (PgdA/CDA1 family)
MTSLASHARRIARFGWRDARALARGGSDRPVILMYHRIGSPPYDPWGLCVSPKRFREHLAVLKSARTLLSVDQLVDALETGDVPPRAAAITFDDGYADNAEIAKPLLEEMEAPATVFLATRFVGSETPFWWDELAALVLAGRAAAEVDLEIGGVRLGARWGPQDGLPRDLAQWRYTDPSTDPRRSGYLGLWRALQRLAPADRERAMAELRTRLADDRNFADRVLAVPMTREATRRMASGVTTVGGHGRSHAPLPGLPPEQQRGEIAGGREDLAAIMGAGEPSGFAYPHGEWDAQTRGAVAAAGYRWAVTTETATIDPRHYDRYSLPRVPAANGSARALLRAMRHGRA